MISRRTLFACIASATLLSGLPAGAVEPANAPRGAHAFVFESIDGGPLALADYAGRPVLVVNTASRCGYTYQYAGLQELWERYRERGLVVLGVPSGDFRQELASEKEVKAFCAVNFSIDFPMTAITSVRGPDAHPFFAWAAKIEEAPSWNFNKYLVAPDGALIGHWGSQVRPASLAEEIEALLGAEG